MRVVVWGAVAVAVAAVLFNRPGPMLAGEPDGKTPAPAFTTGAKWINTEPLTLADLKGKVGVVHFWTHGCINCVHNEPHYKAWQERYASANVKIVGIHTPEFEAEKNADRVRDHATKKGLKYPIVIDNDQKMWSAWHNQYWPTVYLVDKQGRIRHRWEGELGEAGEAKVRGWIEALRAAS